MLTSIIEYEELTVVRLHYGLVMIAVLDHAEGFNNANRLSATKLIQPSLSRFYWGEGLVQVY